MIWRRWVTESSSSATQTSSDHLDRRLSNTRMRPPQRGLVQVGLWSVSSDSAADAISPRSPLLFSVLRTGPGPKACTLCANPRELYLEVFSLCVSLVRV